MSRSCAVLPVLVLFLSLGCVSAHEAAPADPNPMLVEVGQTEFAQYCASCHGVDARGAGPVASELRTPPSDLTHIAARNGGTFPADEIAAWIDGRLAPRAHGTREMPVWGLRFAEGMPPGELSQDLVRGRILTLVEYLRSIQAR